MGVSKPSITARLLREHQSENTEIGKRKEGRGEEGRGGEGEREGRGGGRESERWHNLGMLSYRILAEGKATLLDPWVSGQWTDMAVLTL